MKNLWKFQTIFLESSVCGCVACRVLLVDFSDSFRVRELIPSKSVNVFIYVSPLVHIRLGIRRLFSFLGSSLFRVLGFMWRVCFCIHQKCAATTALTGLTKGFLRVRVERKKLNSRLFDMTHIFLTVLCRQTFVILPQINMVQILSGDVGGVDINCALFHH